MKVAYVTAYDAADIRGWSGLGYFIARALEAQSLQVVRVGPLQASMTSLLRAKRLFYKRLRGQDYLVDRVPSVLKAYADQAADQLEHIGPDVIFSPGTIPICQLHSKVPVVFWTDATCAGMIDFYPNWSNLCQESVRDSHRMEQAALSKCRLAIYSSEWAARTAREHYRVDHAKIRVVPFGANVESVRDWDQVRAIVDQRPKDVCKLLFIGVDWHRKGGDIAVQLARTLNGLGLRTELTVVGTDSQECDPQLEYVSVVGRVLKSTSQGRSTIDRLLAEAHFLVLPSRADCVPVVIAEANSFGTPAITSDVGGIRTAVRDGVNGYALPLERFSERAADIILNAMQGGSSYSELALSSFSEYESRLNWGVAGRRVKDLLEEALAS